MSSSYVYTVPGAYGQPIPWYMLSPDNALHRPFGPFTRGRTMDPPPAIFNIYPKEHLIKLANRLADEAFEERMAMLARTPGAPLPPRGWPTPEPQIPLLGRAVLKVGRGLTRCADRVRGWRDGLVRTKDQVKQDYARVAFAAERKYWLALTAYRQSPWPNTLRQLWYLLLMLVGLVLVVWAGLVKVLAVMEERERQQAHIRAIPMYGVWSVTPLRCPCVGQNE